MYTSNTMGHLTIQAGDVIEVVGSTDCGLLEGYVRGTNRSGYFPAHAVQEVNIRQKNITNVSTATTNQQNIYQRNTVINMHLADPQQQQQQQMLSNNVQQYSSATAPRQKKM